MELKWCWRCKMEIPMINKEEYELCWSTLKFGRDKVEDELLKLKIMDYKWLGEIPKSYEKYRYFIDMYRVLTGFDETNPNAIMHHRLEHFGANCPNCNKSLRTPLARYCVECGFGKDDFKNQNTLPLMIRRKELFLNK